jgi:hypothetical protein
MQSNIYQIIHNNLQFLILSYFVCHKVTIAFHIGIQNLFFNIFLDQRGLHKGELKHQ